MGSPLPFIILCVALLLGLLAPCTEAGLFVGHTSPAPPRAEAPRIPYDPLLALYALNFCKASYCAPDALTRWGCGEVCTTAASPIGFEVVNVYRNASYHTLAFSGLDHFNGNIIVAFRGTTSLSNWLEDLDFWATPYACPQRTDGSSESSESEELLSSADSSGTRFFANASGHRCMVHKGFYGAFQSLAANVTDDLLRLRREYPSYNYFLTGHSLGGAMAYLCAIEIARHPLLLPEDGTLEDPFSPVLLLYTFGEPRSGNAGLTAYAHSLLEGHPSGTRSRFRLTHARDPVPHLPPMSWGYVHLPHELWYHRNSSRQEEDALVYTECEGDVASEDPECSNSVWATSISDHVHYLGLCTQCLCIAGEPMDSALYTLTGDQLAALKQDYDDTQKRLRATQQLP